MFGFRNGFVKAVPTHLSPCPRTGAGRYLTFLANLGYRLAGIEQAMTSHNSIEPQVQPWCIGIGECRAGTPAAPLIEWLR
jgi:hypothetical protein